MKELDPKDYYEYLNYAMSNGIIDVAKLVTEVEMNKRQELLEKHQYSIWQGSNGNWYTYLPDENSNHKGKLVKKCSREKLEDALVSYYSENEKTPTFGECFKMQQTYMIEHFKITDSTYYRKDDDYNKYISGTELDGRRIDSITESELIVFFDNLLAKHNGKITRKAFNNVKSLIGNVFVFAKVIKRYNCIYTKELLSGIIPNRRQLKKKTDRLQVFNDEEVDMLIDGILKNHRDSIRHMGLLFMLFTGVRVGELAVIKLGDISADYRLHIRRTLTKKKDENGITRRVVSEYAKTETSEEEMMLSDDAIKALNRILYLRKVSAETSEWLMAENGEFITHNKFDKCLRKLCGELNIPARGCHCLRKTYCSELLDAGVSEKIVQDQMRHADSRTTQMHYNYCVKTDDAKRKAINAIKRLDSAI